ncbi:hypothetical protein KR009_003202, partial [Drosophila setifemur]
WRTMLLDYLRRRTPKVLLTSPEAFRYFELAMFWMSWKRPQKYRQLFWVISPLIAAWCVVYLPIGIIISFMIDMRTFRPSELLSILQLFFNALGTPLKVFFLRLFIWRFYKAKKLLGKMDERCTEEEERLEVHRWAVRCNLAYLIYQTIYTIYTNTTFLSAALSGHLPMRLYNPLINWRKSSASFWIAAFHENMLMLFSVTHTLMSDIYPLLYGLMLRAHIKLLRLRVEKLCTDPDKSDEENERDLVNCINDHKLIKEFANTIRPVIACTIFVQFLLIGLLLGLCMINLLFFADFWTGLATVAYVNGLILQTFPFCFVCDLIQADCERLTMSIFHSNWLAQSRKYKTTMIFFLQNSQKSIAFKASSIFPISTSTNIGVAKLAFTVVTFVNQLNLADRLT